VNTIRTFQIGDLVRAVRRSGARLNPATAAFILDGPEGFVERGLVARVRGGYVVIDRGREYSELLSLWPAGREA
jgi:hypothetical protein